MANIGKLAAVLTLNSSQFSKGITTARASLSNFGASLRGTIGTVAKWGSMLTGGASVAGMIMLTQRSFEAMDATSKLADRIGATTEGLSGLAHAASLAGVDHEAFQGAIEKMVRSLGQAEQGLQTQSRAFSTLGLSVGELTRMPADRAFMRVAGAIGRVGTAAERAALAADIFGRGSAEIVSLAMSGEKGLADMAREAEQLGLTFTRVGGAKIEMANDAITRLQGLMTGAANTIAMQLAPYLKYMADWFVESASRGEGMGGIISNAFVAVAKSAAILADTLNLISAAWYGIKTVTATAILAMSKAINWLLDKLVAVINYFSEWTGFAVQLNDDFMSTALAEMVAESADAAEKAYSAWASGSASKKLDGFLEDIRKKNDLLAQDIAKTAGERLANLGADHAAMDAGKKAGFEQIVRSRTALGGTSSKRAASDVEAPKQTALLNSICNALNRGVPVIAS